MENKIRSFLGKSKNNKLNFFTYTFATIFFIVYVIGFTVLLHSKYSIKNILSLSADYVTIVSCILVLIQLIAFVKDSRRNEFRSRKEAAYKIAREYADDVLSNMGFIQSVLSVTFNQQDPTKLEKILQSANIESFLSSDSKANSAYSDYVNIFLNEKDDNINYDTINTFSIVYKIPGFMDIAMINEDSAKKHLANIRFESMLFDTLNTLECFAMSVNQNVSDSEMLYASVHQTFLKFVKYVYPFICKQNIDEERFYPNIIKLYYSWNKKELDEEKKKVDLEQKKQDMIRKSKTVGTPL